jgi:hypothetical protein
MNARFIYPTNLRLFTASAILFYLCLAPAFAQTTLTNGLVAYWSFDTTDGTSTPDLALNNSLFLFNSPANGASGNTVRNTGNCFTFNGSSQYLDLSHSTNFAATGLPVYTTHGYTMAFWVNGPVQAANHIIFSDNNFNNGGLLFEFNTSTGAKIRVNVRDDNNVTRLSNVTSTGNAFDNTWHHIAWTDTNGAAKLYIDGNLDSSFSYTASAAPPTGNVLSVGALVRSSGVGNYFNGSVDEVMAWNRVLSQTEIQNAMSNGIPGPIVATPPTVVNQPANHTNSLGDMVLLSANVFGNQPMSYQWLSNGMVVPNQTNSTLELYTLTSPGTNFYSLFATNSAGSNTTSVASVVVSPDPAANLNLGMVSYWPTDTISNSTSTPDLVSQNDFQLANMSGTNLVSGEFGNALAFDGATQYGIEATGTPIYDVSTTYTVALWVKGPSGRANEQVFANGHTNGNYFFIGPDNAGATGKADVRINPGLGDTLSTATAFDGTWHHVVWVDQNGSGLLYIDGNLDPTPYNYTHGTLGSVSLTNTTVGALVANSLRDFYAGSVDDVGTWNRRLTYTEIQTIYHSGIPAPPVIVKPSISPIITVPASLSNDVYQGDTVSFSASVSGTSPFSYQWRTNGVPITGNPSALTNKLVLTNIQPGNSAAYTLVVTNQGGSATSSVVQLSVIPYVPATNGTVLQLEFNPVLNPVVQTGFSSMTLNSNPSTFGGPMVTLSTIGATGLGDRLRTVPTNNPPALTTADIYSQIIFSTANSFGTGIDILVQRLAPNTSYGVTLWSWDSQNSGSSVWNEIASGTPVSFVYLNNNSSYFFSGSPMPAADYDDTLGGLLTSSASGQLEFQGTQNGPSLSVFINALRLVANPTVQITHTTIAADSNLQLTISMQYPNQSFHFQESTTLSPGSWQDATDAQVISTHGPVSVVEFPISSTQLFYRVVSP